MEEKILKATHGSDKTPLEIGNIKIPCYVLEDGRAVISGRGLQTVLGFPKNSSGQSLSKLIKNKRYEPFISEKLAYSLENPIQFERVGSGGSQTLTYGQEADTLIDLCYVLIDAKSGGVKLSEKELILEKQAQVITRAFSKTGINSVIYQLTGYLDDKVKTFLNDILNRYLLDEAKKYKVTYPVELYKEWYRLNNWEWKAENAQKRPSVLGHWTNDLIYKRIAPNILEHLKIKNPKNDRGYREHKHFQFLTDEVGEPRLREFFGGLIALAKASSNWKKYLSMVNRAYPKYGDTLDIPYAEED